MLVLPVSGAFETKVITVNINRLEHIFVMRKNVVKPEDLKGKRFAVSRFGSASDLTTRMVLRSWKLDPEKDVALFQSGNTPTRMTALIAGHVDGALVSPESLHKVLASAAAADLWPISPSCPSICPFRRDRSGLLDSQPARHFAPHRHGLLEGIYAFKTKPKHVYSVLEEEGIKDPAVLKKFTNLA